MMLPTLAILATAPVLAQERTPRTGAQRVQGPETREPQQELPAFVEVTIGPTAIVRTSEGLPIGTITDHLIERRSGSVASVAVRATELERTVRVPFDRFEWDAKARELRLSVDAEELGTMPDDSPDDTHAAASPAADAAGLPHDVRAARELRTTAIDGSPVLAGNDHVGAVSGLVLEPGRGAIAFVLVRPSAGDPLVVPWEALTWSGGSPKEPLRSMLALAPDRLADAPRLERGEVRTLEKLTTLKEIYEYYELPFTRRSAPAEKRLDRDASARSPSRTPGA
jgi:hypothetical protein